ncbi:4'-phosphopantetheinyl transferase family protein [Pseudoprimorskyibacter insulae]|uniref:Enterobactin synthase component D n=1 Tax=Pseudoprimorskyibacter insulae TaxID=1695997 RepID=A0A2R8ATW3_9RHOB|nr:4'-phosphopantetheinyl transferase superfamily protein [Pseudoprimorskyibacter insulae]SPF79478.1 4'-phosphopantetheinyl transferase Npt [Pseudoprimorskyibacter insulae]
MPLDGLTRLLRASGDHMPKWLSVATSDPQDADDSGLYPVEKASISRAIVRRRSEFAAGRTAARKALNKLGLPDVEIPMAEDRSPVWPRGFTGSISHTDTACIAVAAHDLHVRAIGIDLEPAQPMGFDQDGAVCSSRELARMPHDPAIAERMLFSAKEAAYKAQFMLSRTLFGFNGLELSATDGTHLHLTFQRAVTPFAKGERITIRQWHNDAMILSLAVLPSRGPLPRFA